MHRSDSGATLESLNTITIPPTTGQAPIGTIVCLHGYGANAQDLASLAPYLNLYEYQFIFPDAPFPHPQVPGGKAWYSLENNDGLTESQQILADWISSLEKNTGLPLSRTILSGFSQGGAMTLDVGLKFPLAGLVSLSGYLHSGAAQTKLDSFPPVLIVHGKQDMVVPVNAARKAREALTNLGVGVEYQEFNMGHEVTLEVLSLMRSFVLQVISTVDS